MPTYAILLLCIVSAASGRSLSQAVASPQAGAAQGNESSCVATAAQSLGACSAYDGAGSADAHCCSALQALGSGCLDSLSSNGAMGSGWNGFEAIVASCGLPPQSPPPMTTADVSPPLGDSLLEQPKPAPLPGAETGPAGGSRPQPSPESAPAQGGASQGNCSAAVANIAASLCANATEMAADPLQLELCCSTMQALYAVGCQAQLNESLAAANATGSSPLLPDVLHVCHMDMPAGASATVGLASGALAAIVVGAVAAGAAAAGLGALLYRRAARRRRLRDPASVAGGLKTGQPGSPGSPQSLEGCSSEGGEFKSGASAGTGSADPAMASALSRVPTKPRGQPPLGTASAVERFLQAATPSQESEASRAMSQDALWSFISHYQSQATATSHAAATRGSAGSSGGSGSTGAAGGGGGRAGSGPSFEGGSSGATATPRTPVFPLRSRGPSDSGVDFEVPFDQLQIVRPIGAGSFGRVFEARWVETPVACKVLTTCDSDDIATLEQAAAALATSATLLAKLEEEAGLMVSLRHLNIVAYYGRCLRPPCIITEYCSRGSLACVLGEARRDAATAAALTWRRRLSLALDASRGMFYLHSRRCIHRDLKSPNLLVDENWRCKVADFNLSRLLEDAPSERSSTAVTNPRWLAPEVLEGERATQAADTYAFGVCLWELLALSLPWGSGANPWQIAKSVMDGFRPDVPPPGHVPGLQGRAAPPPEQYADYTELLARCWHQDPTQRPEFSEIVPRLRDLDERAAAAAAAAAAAPSPPD